MEFSIQEASFVLPAINVSVLWCAYELHAQFTDGEPPKVIYINYCKMHDVTKIIQPRQNSKYLDLFKHGGNVMLRIFALGSDRAQIAKASVERLRKLGHVPLCNAQGFSVKTSVRKIKCSNGTIYQTQEEAARLLGVSQSAISRHLRNEMATVRGLTFQYVQE